MNYNDISKAITAEDIIRRYNLEELRTDRKTIKKLTSAIENQYTIIKNFIISIAPYTNQADSTVWFSDGVPNLNDSMFDDIDLTKVNLCYDRENGNAYILDDETWTLLDDNTLLQSLALANADPDTEDKKRNVFYYQPTPPYAVGDVWLDGNAIMRCRCSRDGDNFNSAEWVEQEDYSSINLILDVRAALNQFESNVVANYVTSATLETTTESINANVTGLTLLSGAMNKVYKSQPTPPYNKGDLYVIGTSVYVCKKARASGSYKSSDWELTDKATYSTTTGNITVSSGDITSTASTKVGDREVISKINQSPESVTINANKIGLTANDVLNIISGNTINLTSKNIAIDSTNFKVTKDGNTTVNNLSVVGGNVDISSASSGTYNLVLSGTTGNVTNSVNINPMVISFGHGSFGCTMIFQDANTFSFQINRRSDNSKYIEMNISPYICEMEVHEGNNYTNIQAGTITLYKNGSSKTISGNN